jgi:hypothetical protein
MLGDERGGQALGGGVTVSHTNTHTETMGGQWVNRLGVFLGEECGATLF